MPDAGDRERQIDDLAYGDVRLPGMDEGFDQSLARINLVCVASPELDFPTFDLEGRRRFFRYALAGPGDTERIDIGVSLAGFVGAAKLRWLDEIVPTRWQLGEGGFALLYSLETNPGEGHAQSPLGCVKLSELAGQPDHPFVCEGRVAVRLRLLDDAGAFLEETWDWSAHSANRMSRSSRCR